MQTAFQPGAFQSTGFQFFTTTREYASAFTRLGVGGGPARPFGSFAAKGLKPAQERPYSITFTALTPAGTPGRGPGDLSGKAGKVVVLEQPTGGYGFGAHDRKRRREELEREIAALEAHLEKTVPSIVPRGTIDTDDDLPRLRARVREYAVQAERLPARARRAVEYARRAKTKESLLLADRALAQAEEQEALAVLLALALD